MATDADRLIRLSLSEEDARRPVEDSIRDAISVAERLGQSIVLYWSKRPEVRTYVNPHSTLTEITENLRLLQPKAFPELG